MKKLFLFVAATALFAACSETEVLDQNANQQAIENQGGVKFDVYTQRGITRGGGQKGDITNANIGTNGFGVFAYYTAGETYNESAKPNFMYNQQVVLDGDGPATTASKWKYEPVKYWPNEYGNAAISDEVDYVSFFAYAPYTKIEPTTGEVFVGDIDDPIKKDSAQNYNIISVNKNSATGDPIIKYIVDTNPGTSVDLLWGVAADMADKVYTPINSLEGSTSKQNADVKIEAGKPFLNLVKPNDPANDRLMFNLKHALSKVRFTIDYIDDAFTPDTVTPAQTKAAIDTAQTRIFVRTFQISGWATQGALNLNNTEAGLPLWLDFDGVKELTFGDLKFFDGRKDGSEGTVSGDVKNEKPLGLNPDIIENYGSEANGGWNSTKNSGVAAKTITKGADGKYTGIVKKATTKAIEGRTINGRQGKAYSGTVLLFGGDPVQNDGYFYVIPDEQNSKVDVEIAYDVETIDSALATTLSDALTKGLSTENIIRKEDILNGMGFKAGYQYDIHIHLGMTSVKIEATVTDWKVTEPAEVDLPDNQDPQVDTYWTIGNSPVVYTANPQIFTLSADRLFIVDDEGSFNAAYAAGPLKEYYKVATGSDTDASDPRGHSWNALSKNYKNHNVDGENTGFSLPWIVIDTNFDPEFKGTVKVEYNGKTIYDFTELSRNGQKYLIIDGGDLVKKSAATATNLLTWDGTDTSQGNKNGQWIKGNGYQKLDATKFTITFDRGDDVTEHNKPVTTTPNP